MRSFKLVFWAIGLAIQLLGAVGTAETSTFIVEKPFSVYSSPTDGAYLFTAGTGVSVTVGSKPYGPYRKVRVRWGEASRIGFAAAADLVGPRPAREGTVGLALGGLFSRFQQGEKSFTTDDQVQYTISGYSGQNTSPALWAQFGRQKFWRLQVAYRTVDLAGTGRTNISGATSQDIRVQYKMFAVAGEAAWPLWSDYFYWGGGLEYAKSLKGRLHYGNQDLSSQTDYPSFITGFALVGAQTRVGARFSLFAEGRYGWVANQHPSLTVLEAVAALAYWP